MSPRLRREALTELSTSELARLAGGTQSIECVEVNPETGTIVQSVKLDHCFVLSINCYSWHTEEC